MKIWPSPPQKMAFSLGRYIKRHRYRRRSVVAVCRWGMVSITIPRRRKHRRRVTCHATCNKKMQRERILLKAKQGRPAKRQRGPSQILELSQAAGSGMDVVVSSRKRKRLSQAALGVEKKFLDNSLAATAVVSSTTYTGCEQDPATTLCLTAPAQGDGGSNRDGRQIIGKSVHIRGQLNIVPIEDTLANPPFATLVHVAIVLDRQTNNAQENSEDIYTIPGAAVGVATFPMRNMDFAKRFKVLREEVFVFDNLNYDRSAANAFGIAGQAKPFDWFIPLNDLRINFNSTTTGVIGNVLDNSIHVVANTNTTTLAPTIAYNSRFRFIG